MTNATKKPPRERLADYRNKKGYNLREMGNALNVSGEFVRLIEIGKKVPVSYTTRRTIRVLTGIKEEEWESP